MIEKATSIPERGTTHGGNGKLQRQIKAFMESPDKYGRLNPQGYASPTSCALSYKAAIKSLGVAASVSRRGDKVFIMKGARNAE